MLDKIKNKKILCAKHCVLVLDVNGSLHWSLIVICHPGDIAYFKGKCLSGFAFSFYNLQLVAFINHSKKKKKFAFILHYRLAPFACFR